MDVEKEYRAELIGALGSAFECFEEVPLEHPLFRGRKVRADLVAIPVDPRLSGYALAFEVKRPDRTWDYSKWSGAIRQASDYVYGRIAPAGPARAFAGRRIAAAFMFPSPPLNTEGRLTDTGPFVFPASSVMVSGLFHMALHFRVGSAYWETIGRERNFCLTFGPNPVWDTRRGLRTQGINLIAGSRTLGSQRIDWKAELDGLG